jgi:hypothetical protein
VEELKLKALDRWQSGAPVGVCVEEALRTLAWEMIEMVENSSDGLVFDHFVDTLGTRLRRLAGLEER